VERFWLHAQAPFAAYRGMQAGVYRTTAPTIPHSAAFGLVLNLAGIEMRDPTPDVTTQVRADVPRLRIAVGAHTPAQVGTLYQQLHSYPVGNSGKELKEGAHGAKFWIAPVRRELLVGLDVVIGVETVDGALRDRVGRGISGELGADRYGLPFAGDNNLLFDRIDLLDAPPPSRWYTRIRPDDPLRRGTCRLTVGIDRRDSSRTTTVLCAPTDQPTAEPPDIAWVWTPREPDVA
jgi:CRISPR-associated protein Cas5t